MRLRASFSSGGDEMSMKYSSLSCGSGMRRPFQNWLPTCIPLRKLLIFFRTSLSSGSSG